MCVFYEVSGFQDTHQLLYLDVSIIYYTVMIYDQSVVISTLLPACGLYLPENNIITIT